ncbi:hypothetical protein E2C01_078953 [Portunus trituberculatus]|uniref:Uncharacterized protein n=1 Tax=Portunus trituberculatus TaxID=210409 RepID=A0A5B7IVI6_PORTR|nr:hypothetical protein [Portunus trituberculatus]
MNQSIKSITAQPASHSIRPQTHSHTLYSDGVGDGVRAVEISGGASVVPSIPRLDIRHQQTAIWVLLQSPLVVWDALATVGGRAPWVISCMKDVVGGEKSKCVKVSGCPPHDKQDAAPLPILQSGGNRREGKSRTEGRQVQEKGRRG